MRIGAPLSALIHAGVVAAGLFVFQAEPSDIDQSTMITIPLELVTIGDVTDIAPVTEDARIEEEAAEKESEPVATEAAAPPPEPESVAIPEETPPPPPKEVKKPEVKPAPAKSRQEEISSVLDGILAGVTNDKPKKPSTTGDKAANTSKEAPRMGAGQQRKMVASITDYIRAQLVNNRCWTDHSDMADASRLHTTIRVWFGRNGKFSRPYELQGREPSGDPPMQVFVQHARRALDMCNTIGWRVPEEYFQLPQPQYIDITFVPKVAGMQ